MARAVVACKQLFVFEKPERVPIIVATLATEHFEVRRSSAIGYSNDIAARSADGIVEFLLEMDAALILE